MTPSNNKTNKCKDTTNNANKDTSVVAKDAANDATNDGSSPSPTGYDIVLVTPPTKKMRRDLHLDNAILMDTPEDPRHEVEQNKPSRETSR